MRRTGKCVSAIILSAVISVSMAVPTLAASDVTTTTKRHILSNNRGMYLNLEGSGYAYKNRDVTVYYYSSDDDQNWKIQNLGNGLKVYTAKASADGTLYTLNANVSTSNCNIYMDTSSNNSDSVVSTTGNTSSFEIFLAGGSLYGHNLSVDPSSREVMWGSVDTYTWKLS